MKKYVCPHCNAVNDRREPYCRACAKPIANRNPRLQSANRKLILTLIMLRATFIAIAIYLEMKRTKKPPAIQAEMNTASADDAPGVSQPPDMAAIRNSLEGSYLNALQQSLSLPQDIHVELADTRKGLTLFGVHPRFNSQSFNYGGLAGSVKNWIAHNSDDLRRVGIKRVGVKGEHSGAVSYAVN